jgi:arylsulfatase A-like enzyme
MPAPRPNLLLITTDQQRADTIRALGHPHLRTPHLDWLVRSGVTFTRAYSDAPICVAARASLLCGLHHRHFPPGHGDFGRPTLAPGTPSLPGLLSAAGYQTRLVGKAHHHPPRAHFGWQHMELLADFYRSRDQRPGRPRPGRTGLGQNELEPAPVSLDESETLTHWIIERGIDFIETRDPTRPFCLHLSLSKPHPPLDPPLAYWQLYADTELPPPLRGDWSANADDVDPAWKQPTWLLNGADELPPGLRRDAFRAYCALITQLDYNLGLLFARLRELRLLENTLIVFTSDHGEMLGDHHLGAKTVPLEGSARVPFLVRPPTPDGHRAPPGAGGTRQALVCLADIVPTLLSAAGLDSPPGLDGRDLGPLLRGERSAVRDELVLSYSHYHALLSGPHKYCYATNGGAELLFDLATDPGETRELARLPASSALRERLRHRLAELLAASGHPCAHDGDLHPLGPPPDKAAIRAASWPGFHHPDHTDEDLAH